MTSDQFDDMIDNMTHAVYKAVPASTLNAMTDMGRSALREAVNDALHEVLKDYVEQTPEDMG